MQYSLNKDLHHLQMTAAKIIDIISRLPGWDGQAADAVSALHPSKNGRCSQNYLKKFKNRSVQTFGFVYHDTNGLTSWSSMEDPVVPLERNLYGHPLAGLLWERQFENILLKHGWENIPNWECLFVHREKGLFLSVYVDDIKLAGKKQNLDPMWKLLNKEVDLGEPTSFLDHVYLGCTQRQCQTSKDTVDNYKTMFESRISAGAVEKISIPSKSVVFLHGLMTWLVMQRSVWNDIVSWQTRRLKQLYKVSTPCIDDHPLQRRRNEICWRIVTCMLSNCSEMLILGTNWTT